MTSEELETDREYLENRETPDKARALVYGYAKSNGADITLADVKVVWFCKTLQNWKAMVAVIKPGGMFFEVTYNGDKKETYLDAYRKEENLVFKDEN